MPIYDDFRDDDETAALLGMQAPVLRMWRTRGMGPPYYKIGGSVRYRESDVRTWLEAQRREPGEAA